MSKVSGSERIMEIQLLYPLNIFINLEGFHDDWQLVVELIYELDVKYMNQVDGIGGGGVPMMVTDLAD